MQELNERLEKPMLKTERNTPAMEERIRNAFQDSDYWSPEGEIDTAFEHGQWWVLYTPPEGSGDEDTVTYSVVDAVGGRSIDGFDFEKV